MNEQELNDKFADIIQHLDMRDVEEQILEEEIVIDFEDVPTIVFIPVFTDYGMFYSSMPISTKAIESFLIWFNSQE